MPTAVVGARDARFDVDGQVEAPAAGVAGQMLAASALAAAALDGASASRSVSRLVDTSARLTGADPLGLGLLTFADPLLLSAPLDTTTTAVKRMTNPEQRGFVEAFSVQAGRVMAPEDLSVGQHSLRALGTRPGRSPTPMGPITFFIDAPGEDACL